MCVYARLLWCYYTWEHQTGIYFTFAIENVCWHFGLIAIVISDLCASQKIWKMAGLDKSTFFVLLFPSHSLFGLVIKLYDNEMTVSLSLSIKSFPTVSTTIAPQPSHQTKTQKKKLLGAYCLNFSFLRHVYWTVKEITFSSRITCIWIWEANYWTHANQPAKRTQPASQPAQKLV